MQNNQGRGKGYQPKPNAEADNPYSTKIILDITKTKSNNSSIIHETKKMEVNLLLLQ